MSINLEEFCEKNRLDVKDVEKEIKGIMKSESISELAAFKKWQSKNMSELAVRKRGSELIGLYLSTEYVPANDYQKEPVFRIYYLVFQEDSDPVIAYIKLAEHLPEKIFKSDPKPFEAWKFPYAYVNIGERANWIVASRKDDIPEMELEKEKVFTNADIHNGLVAAVKQVEDYYQDSAVEDTTLFNPVFYVMSTGTELRKLKDGREVVQYSFIDLSSTESFIKLTLTDWDDNVEPIDTYQPILIIGGYTKQRVQFKNILEHRKSDKVPMMIIKCPSIQ